MRICLKALYDISNVKLIPKEYVKKGLSFIFGDKKEDEESEIDDIILICVVAGASVGLLLGVYLITRKLPKIKQKIEGILRMIFFNILITAYLKAYLRLAVSSCD